MCFLHVWLGVAGLVAGHPLDTVKVRLQNQRKGLHAPGEGKYRGSFRSMAIIIKEEKVHQ